MARTAQKVESLIDEDADLGDALAVVVERSNEGATEIEWADVRDDLSSGQWGRLIQTGVLVDGDEGFELDDPEAVINALRERGRAPESVTAPAPSEDAPADAESGDAGSEDDDEGWSVWDKLAAGGAIGMFAGYSIASVRNAIGSVLDVALGPLDAALPFYAVVMALAMLTGLYSTLLQANLMDMDKMGEYQERMQDIQDRQKKAKERGDDEALERIREEQMEAMGDQLGMFKLQFRPMVWIMLFTIPVFLWMYWKILPAGTGIIAEAESQLVVPLVGEATWRQGILGPIQLWIVWYFLCSMAFTQIIRKALNIQTSPT